MHGATTNSACSFEAEEWQGKPGIQYEIAGGLGRRKRLGSVVVRLMICCGSLSFYNTSQKGLTIFRYSTRRKVPPYPVPGSKVLLHIATDAKFAHHVAFGAFLCFVRHCFRTRCLKAEKRAAWKVTYILRTQRE
jgi:hypothetical protein